MVNHVHNNIIYYKPYIAFDKLTGLILVMYFVHSTCLHPTLPAGLHSALSRMRNSHPSDSDGATLNANEVKVDKELRTNFYDVIITIVTCFVYHENNFIHKMFVIILIFY